MKYIIIGFLLGGLYHVAPTIVYTMIILMIVGVLFKGFTWLCRGIKALWAHVQANYGADL